MKSININYLTTRSTFNYDITKTINGVSKGIGAELFILVRFIVSWIMEAFSILGNISKKILKALRNPHHTAIHFF